MLSPSVPHAAFVKLLLHSQVDLLSPKKITGIITQGAKDFGSVQFVTAFKVAYSDDGVTWTIVKDDTTRTDKVSLWGEKIKKNHCMLHLCVSETTNRVVVKFVSAVIVYTPGTNYTNTGTESECVHSYCNQKSIYLPDVSNTQPD